MFAPELGRGDQQAAHQGQVRVAKRELRPTQPRHAATDDGELLARAGLYGVGQEGIFDVRHAASLRACRCSTRRACRDRFRGRFSRGHPFLSPMHRAD